MGGSSSSMSEFVEKEKTSWIRPHKLEYRDDLRRTQLALIEKFGNKLELRYKNMVLCGVTYRHFWITDGAWVLEWGAGDDILNSTIKIHSNIADREGKDITIEARFEKTIDVEKRMTKLCGATNYSLALRNCEHAARYVHVGAWVCFQMVGEGILTKQFFSWMSQHTKLINIAPDELQVTTDVSHKPLYSEMQVKEVKYQFTKKSSVLDASQKRKYTILFLGPTGAGKSRLINLLFNQEVARSKASSDSITKEVNFFEGKVTYLAGEERKEREEEVVMIDTVGFCDSEMSVTEVLDTIRISVQVNATDIDKIFLVLSGRVERGHKDSVKKAMEWLKLKDYPENVCLVYTKCEDLSPTEKYTELSKLCDIFNMEHDKSWRYQNEGWFSVRPNMTVGFGSRMPYSDIQEDYYNFCLASAYGIQKNPRTRVEVDPKAAGCC